MAFTDTNMSSVNPVAVVTANKLVTNASGMVPARFLAFQAALKMMMATMAKVSQTASALII